MSLDKYLLLLKIIEKCINDEMNEIIVGVN